MLEKNAGSIQEQKFILTHSNKHDTLDYHDLSPSVLHLDGHPLVVIVVQDPAHGHLSTLLHV